MSIFSDSVLKRSKNGWRYGELAALLATIPAFYLALLSNFCLIAIGLYLLATLGSAAMLLIEASPGLKPGLSRFHGLIKHQISLALVPGLLLSVFIPAGEELGVLIIRLATSLLIVLGWSAQCAFRRVFIRLLIESAFSSRGL